MLSEKTRIHNFLGGKKPTSIAWKLQRFVIPSADRQEKLSSLESQGYSDLLAGNRKRILFDGWTAKQIKKIASFWKRQEI